MPREVIEYWAVGVHRYEDGAHRSMSVWCDRADAERVAGEFRVMTKAPFDEVFLERRTVTYGEPERVEEEDDA